MCDQEHVDVTTMESFAESPPPMQNSSLSKCGYCDCGKEGLPVFHCESCGKWVHTSCLHSGSPSPILFDNYFIFKCIRCSEDGKESFTRMRITWNQVTSLTLFNLAQSSPGKDGFHKWKETVVGFIEKHWDLLFGSYKKRTNTWANTIAATLSAGNPRQFTSGYGHFKECGWWKLTDPSIPPEHTPSTIDSVNKESKSRKLKLSVVPTLPSNAGKVDGLRKRPYSSSASCASQQKEKSRTQQKDSVEKERDEVPEDSPPSFKGCASPIPSLLSSPRSLSVTSMLSKGDMVPDSSLPFAILSDDSDMEQDCSKSPIPRLAEQYFSPLSAYFKPCTTPPLCSSIMGENISSCNGGSGSAFLAVRKRKSIKVASADDKVVDAFPKVHQMSYYGERALLKKLVSYGSLLKAVPEASRLKRKLLLRQKNKELNTTTIGFDTSVRHLLASEKGAPIPYIKTDGDAIQLMAMPPSISQSQHHRILDRFQCPALSSGIDMHSLKSFRQKLVGQDDDDIPNSIISPYAQRVLKPYIRKDYESKPLKLAVLNEIILHPNNRQLERAGLNVQKASIDFCYVQPQHISPINAMCRHFFWPGIDVSETLQYPDFSIVALYKKMVIGFGFLVPDANFNEAYISFLFVHPDWQRAGIGTFMIYHLIQSCMGKEVTLHVSASNPAMLLYQKFGFKPEQFIADFYDKYHAVESMECKHAFFMRLRR